MFLSDKDTTRISFKKLSDRGVLEKSPFSGKEINPDYFTDQNFQYIADNITDMFGLAKGCVQATVMDRDYCIGWLDYNGNGNMDDDELILRFTMNAAINTYRRQSYYGKHFMFSQAMEYGNPVVFGIVAHEIGHLINRHVLSRIDRKFIGRTEFVVEIQRPEDRWDELCADYLAGVVLGKADPPVSPEPLKEMIRGTQADDEHPDGFWRVFAVEMGYQWAHANSSVLTSRIIEDRESLRQLLISFFTTFYNKVYSGVDLHTRSKYSGLSPYLLISCSNPIAKV